MKQARKEAQKIVRESLDNLCQSVFDLQCRVVCDDSVRPDQRVLAVVDLNRLVEKISRFEKNTAEFLSFTISVDF